MQKRPRPFCHLMQLTAVLLTLVVDAVYFLRLCLRSPTSLAAENLFLRKQLALYQAHHTTPRRATNATRLALVWLGRWFDWRQVLAIVQPATFLRWHRQGFQLFWRWKLRPGRPRIPAELQALIRQMAQDNPTWGQERIANELLLKLGLRVSPRTVRKYMPGHCVGAPGAQRQSQRWSTFIRNHAQGIVACDFCVVVTATFRILYVFVVIEHASRRLLHVNVREAMANAIIHSEVCNMVTKRVVIPGIVKNGVVVPQNDTLLPDGAHVEIVMSPAEVPPELQSELDQWDKASDESWTMIDAWEAEEQ